MPVKWNQAPRIVLLLAASTLLGTGRSASVAKAGTDDGRAALAARCDELVRAAARGPYGWGWTPEVAAAQGSAADPRGGDEDNDGRTGGGGKPINRKRKPAAPGPRGPVLIDGRATALIGYELFRAGGVG